ncbi:unnamed protein product, partial [Musa banksii]
YAYTFRWEGIITADHRRPRGKSPIIAPVIRYSPPSYRVSLVRIVKMDEQIVSALGEVRNRGSLKLICEKN